MNTTKTPDFEAAANFMAGHARVLDRRVFQRLFQGGAPGPVRDAVAAYRNEDGGFGHGLEPDLRTGTSQPAAVEMALRLMDLTDEWDTGLVTGAIDWLAAIGPAEGGSAFAEPGLDGGPHAPWWVPADGHPASLIQTGQIAGTLYARGFSHPWLDRATPLMWERLDSLTEVSGYPMLGVLAFLQHVPDRSRAKAAFEKVGPLILRNGLVALDPGAAGEVFSPLDFAPMPDSMARALFDDATISAHLDHLASAQRDDGGWMFNWPAWSPAAEADWRGFLTVDALRVLRANGRAVLALGSAFPVRHEAQVPLGDVGSHPARRCRAAVGRLVLAHGVLPDAAPDGEPDERVDLAGCLQPVVETVGGRVPAKDDQVGRPAARPGLVGDLARRRHGLEALDLPYRGLDAMRLVVSDHPGDQARAHVAVVRGGVMANLGELGVGGGHEQLVEHRHASGAQAGADLGEAA
jgi:hypothetical protein